jgi:hypothetical protein
MSSAICTLFEGHYHFGVAVLVNSLYKNGFRGEIYAGYKGKLPAWASNATVDNSNTSQFENVKLLSVTEGIKIYFIELTTKSHLTNYKPDFMLSVINGPAKNADAVFYFDPDIVQVAPWTFMEEWVKCGVAVCEDVNSPLEELHPKRVYWRNYFGKFGQQLRYKSNIYVNGGFVAVTKNDFDFLNRWCEVQENMAIEIGGLDIAIFNKGKKIPTGNMNDFYAFGKTDQDALNATLELYQQKASYLTKEAMNFAPGLSIIPHAIGRSKPWNKSLLKVWLKKGHKPSLVDKLFWSNALSPINAYTKQSVKMKMFKIGIVSFLSRFYKK